MATTIDISSASARKSRTRKPTLEAFPSPLAEEVTHIELQNITAHYSKIYGCEVVEDRAIPDFRDGLKPVHRAALWAMYVNKMHYNTKHKKAARTVGDVIGKYRPHGDASAYGAMVTIANYVMPNLIDGKGNWGNHVDPAAAYRYCFHGGTRVMTDEGLVRIKDIPTLSDSTPLDYATTSGLKVDLSCEVSSLHEPKKASHWINSGQQDTLRITTELGNFICCTPNEPLYVLEGLDYVWKNACDLELGDKVCLKLETNVSVASGKRLPAFEHTPGSTGHTYPGSYFPSTMTTNLAFVLGALVAEGSCRGDSFGVCFSNTSKQYYSAFKRAWTSTFDSRIVTRESLKEPNGYGKKKYMAFHAPYGVMGQWFKNVGVRWGSYNQVVPEYIFRASREEVTAFLSALFEGDGSVHDHIVLDSRSKKLLLGVQQLLLSYFGVYSSLKGVKLYVTGLENTVRFIDAIPFVTKRKQKAAKALRESTQKKLSLYLSGACKMQGGFTHNSIPKSFVSAIKREVEKHVVGVHTVRTEAGSILSKAESGYLLFHRISTNRLMYQAKLLELANSTAAKNWPKLIAKMQSILDDGYYFADVTAIRNGKKAWVYDLTVPETHAFIANGFVAHNTEARLSEFSDKFLLDKDYLAVVPMVENFDGTEKWPLFLPALLPVQLLVGSPPAPAYGISAGTPSFKLKGVVKLVSLALAGKEITPQMCLKYLELNQRFGGICTSSDAERLELYATGKGSLRFVPEIVAADDQKLISIMSCCPGGFQSEKSINSSLEKIAGFPAVAKITDSSGRGGGKYGIKYNIALKRVSDDVYDDTFDKIEKAVSGSMSYHIGYTHRKREETTFGRMNIPQFIHTWVKYRLNLELAVLRHLIGVEQKKLERQQLLLWGTDHIDDIAAALKDRTLGPKKRLMKLWPDKSEEFVGEILKLQVQQLARLERGKVLEKIKEIQREIAALKVDQKQPAVRILRTFDATITAYSNKTSDRLE